MGVHHNFIIPVLTKSIQQQDIKIKKLETENATLKTQMADVLARLSALEG